MTQISSEKMQKFEEVVVDMARDDFEEMLTCITSMFLSLTLAFCEKKTGDASGKISVCSNNSERKITIHAEGA